MLGGLQSSLNGVDNGSGQLDYLTWKGNAVTTKSYTTLSDSSLPSPVGKGGLAVFLAGVGLHGSIWVSDNTQFWPLNGGRILVDIFADGVFYIHPAATFTSVTASTAAAGADTLLTSAGVHGLTAAAAVGSYLYISAGTGWTPGNHKITAIAVDSTGTTIQIDTPFTSQGSPTITLLNNYIPVRSITIPALRSNSVILADLTVDAGGIVGVKTFKAELNGTSFWTPSSSANTIQSTSRLAIQNVNSTSIQTNTLAANNVTQTGTGASAAVTAAIDTSVPTTLILYAKNANANEKVGFMKGIIEVQI